MPAKKLAVTLAGAVSLGAYEAGVALELLRLLDYHNGICDRNGQPDQKIEIDVLTGASAGGMTATILAQKLLFQPDRLADPKDNDLYLPWVRDVDLSLLLATAQSDADASIFSSSLIDQISARYLTDPYQRGLNVQPQQRHSTAAQQVHLGLAMSNLNGITYGIPLASGGNPMPYTRYQDEFGTRTPIDATNTAHNTASFWEPIRHAAIACGAFPFAFRPHEVCRDPSDYPVPDGYPAPIFPPTGMRFAYTDGGLFQNEPIGLAKNLVDSIDNHLNDNRYYLFIAPALRQATTSPISASTATLLDTAKAVINAIFNQARYRDLEHIEQINERVRVFDTQALGLQSALLNGSVPPGSLTPATQAMLPLLFAAPGVSPDGSRSRLKQQFADEYQALLNRFPAPATVADDWIDAILVLETAAGIGPRDVMTVYAITDDSNKLAGSGLFAFAGFFDIAYRQHDYNLGRQSARDFVDWLNHDHELYQDKPCVGPIYLPDPHPNMADPIQVDHSLDQLSLASIPADRRTKLRDQIHGRIHNLLEDLGLNWVAREAIDLGYLNNALKRQLGL